MERRLNTEVVLVVPTFGGGLLDCRDGEVVAAQGLEEPDGHGVELDQR
jgi:hypothetical protein